MLFGLHRRLEVTLETIGTILILSLLTASLWAIPEGGHWALSHDLFTPTIFVTCRVEYLVSHSCSYCDCNRNCIILVQSARIYMHRITYNSLTSISPDHTCNHLFSHNKSTHNPLLPLDTPISKLVQVEDVDEHGETHKGSGNGETSNVSRSIGGWPEE